VRSDRRAARAVAAAAALAAAGALACRDGSAPPAQAAVPERFAGVRAAAPAPAARDAFCERTYPAGGEGARRWSPPPLRPLPGARDAAAAPAGGWTWVNLWATWCAPCVEEMELLGRWRDGLARDGTPVRFELLSVDAPDRGAELSGWRARRLPGAIRWLRSEDDLGPLLDALGVERGAMIPIHALVDGAGWVRCVLVGAVRDPDYAAVKAFLAASSG
jgi:thiol-disulfide isomerase/thioredoxin